MKNERRKSQEQKEFAEEFRQKVRRLPPPFCDDKHIQFHKGWWISLDMNESTLYTFQEEFMDIYSKVLSLYHPPSQNYWIQLRCVDQIIIVSDYAGIKMFSLNLELLYNLQVTEEMRLSRDVYNFDVDGQFVSIKTGNKGTPIITVNTRDLLQFLA